MDYIFLTDKRFLYEGLTRRNYFPHQKEGINELPPYFNTTKFTPEIAELLNDSKQDADRKTYGYDHITFQATRHNNVPRNLALLHPQPYASLCKIIHDQWDNINYIVNNDHSLIKPQKHLDGRLIVMNYEDPINKNNRDLKIGFGKKFKVNTDISNCFNSIYSHSISWAVIGFDQSKEALKKHTKDNHWSAQLDFYQRKNKRNETQGIPIGPATSNIISELILEKIDSKLKLYNFEFYRYIDDYTCFCDTYENAQFFINVLNKELNEFKLTLNLHKTSIVELPEPLNKDWINHLNIAKPSITFNSNQEFREFTASEISNYLDYAIRLNKETPDGSVLKYAVGSIIKNLGHSSKKIALSYILNLSFHYPILIPYLEFFEENFDTDIDDSLLCLISENSKYRRSDGICWPLHLLRKKGTQIPLEIANKILESKDCLSIVTLYKTNGLFQPLIDFINTIIQGSIYLKDQYWLLLYCLYQDNHIKNPYNDYVFEILNSHEVVFVDPPQQLTKAEKYCDIHANPFWIGEIPSFNQFIMNS